MKPETLRLLREGNLPKGDVLGTARVAGIMAAKRTSELIPMCHPLLLTNVAVEFAFDEAAAAVEIRSTVRCRGQTGVEMEALTAASVAALTIYDMAKAVERGMVIEGVRLLEKRGGQERPVAGRGGSIVKIRVRFFAGLRERFGANELFLDLPDNADVAAALACLDAEHPDVGLIGEALHGGCQPRLCAARPGPGEGDEMALIPPVSGGLGRSSSRSRSARSTLDEVAARVVAPERGGITVFAGTVRGVTANSAPTI